MRDLTETEINEYFDFIRSDPAASYLHLEQTQLVADIMNERGVLDQFAKKCLAGIRVGMQPADMILSLWVCAFQMGRECECRLMTRALKGEKHHSDV